MKAATLMLSLALVACTGTQIENERGEAGEPGAPGRDGARGPRGLPGADCQRGEREEVAATSAPLAETDVGSVLKVAAMCSDGAQLVAGGCSWAPGAAPTRFGAVEPFEARPVLEEEAPGRDGWVCQALAARVDGLVAAWAICETEAP